MKNAFFAGLLLLATTPAWAQTTVKTKTKSDVAGTSVKTKTTVPAPQTPQPDDAKIEAKANELTDNLRKALSLTPAQTEKVRQINLQSIRNVEAARIKYRGDLPKLNAAVEDIGQGRLTMLKDVLTPAQFDSYQTQREKKMGIPNTQSSPGSVPGLPPGAGYGQ